jgi:hypothetical protein
LDGEGGKPTHTSGLSFAEDDDPDPEPEPRSLRRTDVECWAAFGVVADAMAEATSDEGGREIGEGVANNQLLAAVVATAAEDADEDEDNLLKGVVIAEERTPAPPGLPASAALEAAGERGKSAAAARDAEERAGEEVEEGGDIRVEADLNSGMLLAGRDAAAAAATTAAAAVATEQGGAAIPAAAFGAGGVATTVMATLSSPSARSLRFTFCASRGDALGAAVGAEIGGSIRAATLLLAAGAGGTVTHAAAARRGDRARVGTADDGGGCSDEAAPVCPVVDVSALLSVCVVVAPGAALLAATGAERGGMRDTEGRKGAGRTEHGEGACSRSTRQCYASPSPCVFSLCLRWVRSAAGESRGEERRTAGGQRGAGDYRVWGLNVAPSRAGSRGGGEWPTRCQRRAAWKDRRTNDELRSEASSSALRTEAAGSLEEIDGAPQPTGIGT